jgi:hypothetical protein
MGARPWRIPSTREPSTRDILTTSPTDVVPVLDRREPPGADAGERAQLLARDRLRLPHLPDPLTDGRHAVSSPGTEQ